MKVNKLFASCAALMALSGCGSDVNVDNQQGSVSISGTPIAGETLTANVTDPDGVSVSAISYQWLVNDIPLTSQTSSTFALTADQRGAVVRVAVTYIDDGGTRESATSASTAPVLANAAGEVSLSGQAVIGNTLTASLSDDNGVSGEVSWSWTANGEVIEGATSSTFDITSEQDGTVLVALASYTDDDGFVETASSAPTDTISANTPASFANLTSSITNVTATPLTGQIVVTDVDEGEALILAQSDVTTAYGVFSIDETGAWTYVLNTSDATVAALAGAFDTLTDSASFESVDGTSDELVITITGVSAPSAGNQAAVIRDLSDDDTGELRYTLPEALAQGRLEVTFTRTDDEVGSKDGFITLFNSSNSNSGNILDLRVRDDSYGIRSPSSIDLSAVSVVPGELHEVVATWEYPSGNTATGSLPTVTLNIDGVAIPVYEVSGSDPVGGVTTVSFRFGDNSSVLSEEAQFIINEFAVYSDTAGETLIFADDFSTYGADTSLDSEIVTSSPYASNSEDVSVEAFDDGSVVGGPGTSGNKYAQITDTLDSDTGELRFVLPAEQAEGKVSFAFARTDDNVGSADAFFTLYNSGNNNAGHILDLRIRDDSFQTRSPQNDIDTALAAVNPGSYHTVDVTWAYPDGNTAEGSFPVINLSIDGVAIPEYTVDSSTNPVGGVATVAFRFGGNSATTPADAQLWVDNIAIYADAAGTTLVFEDNFETYPADFDLNGGTSTPYNERTSEAVVKIEE